MRHWLQTESMPRSLNIHEPALVNTLGHCAGLLLFGYLFFLLVRDFRGRRGDRPLLPALAALLASIYNAGSLVALGSNSPGGDIGAAISFAALSLLPAVLLSISLRGTAALLRLAGWWISGAAVCLHIAEIFAGGASLHRYGLILIAAGFTLLAALSAIDAGRRSIGRVMVPVALLIFAASFVHFTETSYGQLWSRELALHHAGIPLALFIVLQDYRFLMADVFIRGLATSLLAALMTVLAVAGIARWDLAGAAGDSPFAAGLLMAGACCAIVMFSSLRAWIERALTRYVFHRGGVSAEIKILETAPLPGTEKALLASAASLVSRYVRAERMEIHPGIPETMFLPQPANFAAHPWAEAAVPLRFVRGEAVLLIGRREGGRRYLSGDFEDLSRFALAIVSRVERFRAHERELLATRAELRFLQARINPHFLFNSLNALYGSIPRTAAEARRTVLNLSEIFRYFLQDGHAAITVADEIRIVRAYLEIEQLRLGTRLVTEFDIDPEALSEPMPALSIEPLVENAVKHGVAPWPEPGLVRLIVRRGAGFVEVTVQDSGRGFEEKRDSEGAGVGLDNVRQRLLMSYGPAAALDISRNGGMTSVSFRIPTGAGVLTCAS